MAHEANAQALRFRLERLGYASTIRKGRAAVSQHVVFVSVPRGESDAHAMMEKLKTEGFSASVRESRGGFRVEAGRSVLLDDAIDLARDLQKKGFTPTIAQEAANTMLYQVRVGRFKTRAQANRASRELQEKGFAVLIARETFDADSAQSKRGVPSSKGGKR
jgi:cell division protein FtsN